MLGFFLADLTFFFHVVLTLYFTLKSTSQFGLATLEVVSKSMWQAAAILERSSLAPSYGYITITH